MPTMGFLEPKKASDWISVAHSRQAYAGHIFLILIVVRFRVND